MASARKKKQNNKPLNGVIPRRRSHPCQPNVPLPRGCAGEVFFTEGKMDYFNFYFWLILAVAATIGVVCSAELIREIEKEDDDE
jgi:hypothetical protein